MTEAQQQPPSAQPLADDDLDGVAGGAAMNAKYDSMSAPHHAPNQQAPDVREGRP